MNKDGKENQREKKIQELDQYIEDVQTRIIIYKFIENLSNEEFWKLEKELEEKNDDNSGKLMDLNLPVDDVKRVELFEKILNDKIVLQGSLTSVKYQKSEIGMDGICEKAGLSNETVQLLSVEKPDIASLIKYKESLLNSNDPQSSKRCLSDGYVMTHIPRGTCLIINNTFDYDQEWDRKGTNFDRDRLARLFEWLHFEVDVRNDLKACEIRELFNNLGDNIREDSDCFVCCILTHGRPSDIYGNDKETVPRKILRESVKSDSCKKLANKPKIFLIQACRREFDTEISKDAPPTDLTGGKRATQADICMVAATTEDDIAYRDKSRGSFFIQTLCEVFEKHADAASFMEMVTETNKQLSDKKICLEVDDKNFQVSDSTMMTLCRPLYFKPEKIFKDY